MYVFKKKLYFFSEKKTFTVKLFTLNKIFAPPLKKSLILSKKFHSMKKIIQSLKK